MNATIWDIISSLSSAIGAISIPFTIYLSMRPYKRIVSLFPEMHIIHFNKESDIAQVDLKVANYGEKRITYQSWGVSNGNKKYLFELERKTVLLETDQCQSHCIPQSTFESALNGVKSKYFRFYIIDNYNNKFFSKKYRKNKYFRNNSLNIFFS